MREQLADWRGRVRDGIERAFSEDNSPREIAASFGLGTFVVVLPTAGTALVVFVLVASLFERVSKLGLLATLVVFNPVVKWGIYGASFWVGTLLLGPVPGGPAPGSAPLEFSFTAAPAIVVRQFLGNVLVAAALAAAGYLVVLRLVRDHVRRAAGDGEVPDPG